MSLSSSSELEDALAQYNDNLSWETSSTKAALALEAIRWLLANRPKVIASSSTVNINFESLREEKIRLESFIDSNNANTNRSYFVRGRMLT